MNIKRFAEGPLAQSGHQGPSVLWSRIDLPKA
jgi:hypothetical protein